MNENFFSSKKLFEIKDNAVPPFIRDCFIALISPFEKLFTNGQVPGHSLDHLSTIPDPCIEPIYPYFTEFKKDWIEWIYLELKVRLELGVRYYNFLGEKLSNTDDEHLNPLEKRKPIILFLRKFRRVGSMIEFFDEETEGLLQQIGASQILTGAVDSDTLLRGEIERRFPSHPVLWIANPRDALSVSGYLTNEDKSSLYLNLNSIPFILTPMYSIQDWRKSVEYLIRASDAIIIANVAKEGGIHEELELIYSVKATDRTFVTNPENLDPSFSNFRLVDDLTEEILSQLKGEDPSFLSKLPGWGHWAGFESLEYARQYVAAIDEVWGINLDSGKEISPGYFASLFTALMALLIFRGELSSAGMFAQTLANAIIKISRGENIEFLREKGKFHEQEFHALEILLETSEWYSKYDKLYHQVVGFSFLDDRTEKTI
jgi:hypothetical protein